ncbi:MAG: hypothetical protein KME04_19135 [Pleurocapsa minor GSE-CHR-MK-17-07R]|nr:hypothetical protein [Pleurocapsa minor GSE-CHR-MK 17-07R]
MQMHADLLLFTGASMIEIPDLLGEARGIFDLDELTATPDVILARGHLFALAAITRFPTVPVVMLADRFDWEVLPPFLAHIALYVAFSGDDARRLMLEYGVHPDRVVTAFVPQTDLSALPLLPAPQTPPRRALIADDTPDNEPWIAAITHVFQTEGIDVQVLPVKQVPPDYAEKLADIDLVVAHGELAAAAAACGRRVIIAAPRTTTWMLRLHTLDDFLMRAFTPKFGEDAYQDPGPLRVALAQREHDEVAALAEKVRAHTLAGIRARIHGLERVSAPDLTSLGAHCTWAARAFSNGIGGELALAHGRVALLERALAEAQSARGTRTVSITTLDPEAYRAPRPADCSAIQAELDMMKNTKLIRYIVQPWWNFRARMRKARG